MDAQKVDAVVIGAGAGGLCAAARLAYGGLHTLVVDDKSRLGGRASTEEIDGFKVNIGAIAIEFGGVFEETFRTVGAPLNIRAPEPASSFFIDGKLIDVGRGGWSLLLGQLTKQASRILERFADARSGNLPDGRESTEDWLRAYTNNATVHALFRNLCAAIFACNAAELPARAFLTYFTSKGAFKKFGFCPDGTIGVWTSLADAIKRNGDVWLETPATEIHTIDGRVIGVAVQRNGAPVRIETDLVISNAGPKATVALAGEAAFPAGYVAKVRNDLRPAANIVINIASREPLVNHPGIVTFGKTRRLCNMANLSATCPELAPAGWHLYVAYAVPVPALGDFDSNAEVELALADLREQFGNFDRARILSIRVMRDDWPAQRSCAGYDLPRETGIAGLWCVGDAVKQYGNGGTQACAETAKIVTDAILSARPRLPQSSRI
ncbi:NAD(P)/FAD-dependent oxidoreductase [Bradyrhizobium sp. 147]|uniref:phytoene desaturase family protein n=1 Tax=unclassified Bradyrhizobium TaxID=2631580 RepID=UPI001FFB87FA|nr:NAD(P)/FAD-dependent oxidoreductase [Bradyrhizobium sp. 160]MCK1678877.1 NAD(P)/FAD-dependent oxidoreductase [Bradyrhizobium sp. 147]